MPSSSVPSLPPLAGLAVSEFVDRLASSSPAPASGCAAALQGAMGAALVSMAFRHAAGEGPPAACYLEGRADELAELARRLVVLVDEDARAWRAFARSEAGSEARGRAARGALDVPLEVAETCLAALRLAARGAASVAPALASERAVGLRALEAGLSGALLLARENAPAVERALADGEWCTRRLAVAEVVENEAARVAAGIATALADGATRSEP